MVESECNARHARLGAELLQLWRRLEEYRACVTVAVATLRYQNADLDAEVATTLQRSVERELDRDVELLGDLLGQVRSRVCEEGQLGNG